MTDDTTKLYVSDKLKDEREESDERYAIKLVERIVFGAMGLIAITVIGAILALVIRT